MRIFVTDNNKETIKHIIMQATTTQNLQSSDEIINSIEITTDDCNYVTALLNDYEIMVYNHEENITNIDLDEVYFNDELVALTDEQHAAIVQMFEDKIEEFRYKLKNAHDDREHGIYGYGY